MHDEIPAFLRLTPEERAAAWRGRKLTTMRKAEAKQNYELPRSIDATGLAILRQQAAARRAQIPLGPHHRTPPSGDAP